MLKLLNIFLESFRFQREIKRTINELSKLTDRELADIGISRYSIPSIAHQVTLKYNLKEQV